MVSVNDDKNKLLYDENGNGIGTEHSPCQVRTILPSMTTCINILILNTATIGFYSVWMCSQSSILSPSSILWTGRLSIREILMVCSQSRLVVLDLGSDRNEQVFPDAFLSLNTFIQLFIHLPIHSEIYFSNHFFVW